MPHATCGAMIGPIKASQWAMDTTYELLWCIVVETLTRETLTRRPQQLESFKMYLQREPNTMIYFLLGSRVVLNIVPLQLPSSFEKCVGIPYVKVREPDLGTRATRT